MENDRLKDIRKDLRLNQAEMAEKMGKNQTTWSGYEVGRNTIPHDVYMQLQEMGYNIEWLKEGIGEMKAVQVSATPQKGSVPFYRLDVTAHISETFNDLDSHEPEYYISMPGFSHCMAFPVSGDSMSPRISSGDTIFVKPLNNFDVILWGEVYLIITNESADNLRTIKRVFQSSDPSKLILRSINPEYAGDTVIPKESVITMGLVKGCFKSFAL